MDIYMTIEESDIYRSSTLTQRICSKIIEGNIVRKDMKGKPYLEDIKHHMQILNTVI